MTEDLLAGDEEVIAVGKSVDAHCRLRTTPATTPQTWASSPSRAANGRAVKSPSIAAIPSACARSTTPNRRQKHCSSVCAVATQPRVIEARKRDQRAYELRMQGFTWKEVAERCSYSDRKRAHGSTRAVTGCPCQRAAELDRSGVCAMANWITRVEEGNRLRRGSTAECGEKTNECRRPPSGRTRNRRWPGDGIAGVPGDRLDEIPAGRERRQGAGDLPLPGSISTNRRPSGARWGATRPAPADRAGNTRPAAVRTDRRIGDDGTDAARCCRASRQAGIRGSRCLEPGDVPSGNGGTVQQHGGK